MRDNRKAQGSEVRTAAGDSSRHSRRGIAAVLVIVLITVLIGFAALTIDVGYLYNVRGQLQNAVDSAALAGASALPGPAGEVIARARASAHNNRADRNPVDLLDGDIEIGHWDAVAAEFTSSGGSTPPNACRVTAHLTNARKKPVGLFFAPIFGRLTADVSAHATASFGTAQRWKVAIVQDVTGSFVDEIDEARIADQGLLDCIRAHAPETEVGLVVFTGYGKLWAPLQHVEDAYDIIFAAIGNIRSCGQSGMPKCSGTNIGAGIDAAITLLTDATSERPPMMIIVSDGMPNSSLPGYSNADLATWAINSADKAAAQGIAVFTLFYSGNDGTAGAADFLASLVRGKGTAHHTPKPSEMATELQEMCLEGLPLVLVQ